MYPFIALVTLVILASLIVWYQTKRHKFHQEITTKLPVGIKRGGKVKLSDGTEGILHISVGDKATVAVFSGGPVPDYVTCAVSELRPSYPTQRESIANSVSRGGRGALILLGFGLMIPLKAAENSNAWTPPLTTPNIHLTELFSFYGLPKTNEAVTILVNSGYAVGYSEKHKCPLYAVYRYGNRQTDESVKERYYERTKEFVIDLRTKAQVSQDDYTSSGFDRGHVAPNSGIRSQYGHLAQIETFLMSNIMPQHKLVNRGPWKTAEHRLAQTLSQDDRDPNSSNDDITDLWIISGPIFDGPLKTMHRPQRAQGGDWILNPDGTKKLFDTGIAMPSGFFKIIVRASSYKSYQALALYYPHFTTKPPEAQSHLREQLVTVDFIEEKTGLDFHPNLIDSVEKRLEEKRRNWNWELD